MSLSSAVGDKLHRERLAKLRYLGCFGTLPISKDRRSFEEVGLGFVHRRIRSQIAVLVDDESE